MRKEEIEFNPEEYNTSSCMQFEKDTLGTCITHTPWWNTVIPGAKVTKQLKIKSVLVKKDRNGRNMAFVTFEDQGIEIKAVAFASTYTKSALAFNKKNAKNKKQIFLNIFKELLQDINKLF